ncbi:UNVERIFIED_CONTAM: hypothetical protein QE602_11925, partial [Streptococcus suis]
MRGVGPVDEPVAAFGDGPRRAPARAVEPGEAQRVVRLVAAFEPRPQQRAVGRDDQIRLRGA